MSKGRTELPPCGRGLGGFHSFPVSPVNAPCLGCGKTCLELMGDESA